MSPVLYLVLGMFAVFIGVLGFVSAQDWLHARRKR
jgi:hypothetical protein